MEELSTGEGCANIVYLAKPGKGVPALLVGGIEREQKRGGCDSADQGKTVSQRVGGLWWGTVTGRDQLRQGQREYACRIEEWR